MCKEQSNLAWLPEPRFVFVACRARRPAFGQNGAAGSGQDEKPRLPVLQQDGKQVSLIQTIYEISSQEIHDFPTVKPAPFIPPALSLRLSPFLARLSHPNPQTLTPPAPSRPHAPFRVRLSRPNPQTLTPPAPAYPHAPFPIAGRWPGRLRRCIPRSSSRWLRCRSREFRSIPPAAYPSGAS